MLVTCRATRILFEATDRLGVSSTEILDPLGLARAPLVDPTGAVQWSVITRILDRLAEMLGGDPERLQAVGRSMTYVEAYSALRVFAASTVSAGHLYRLAARWIVPANFPHIPLRIDFDERRVVSVEIRIPEPHAPSEPFFHLAIGAMAELPALLGRSPSRILSSRVTPRSLDLELALPPRRSLLAQTGRALGSLLHGGPVNAVFEEQRRNLAEGLEAVQQARDELRIILEGLPDLVVIHHAGTIRFVNRALVRAVGRENAMQLVGTRLADLVDGSLEGEHGRVRFRTMSGELVRVELAPVTPVTFEGEHAELVVGRDVSERERLQQQLAVADRLAAIGMLAAGVAHEINNPLGYVLNNIEHARKELANAPKHPTSADEALRTALEGVDRIRFIVRELLVLARSDDGAPVPTDVSAAVESTLALARIEIQRSAKLVVDFRPAPAALATVPRIAQIVLNLVLNALEAISRRPDGPGELAIRVRPESERHVVLEVSDNGVGVPPEAQPLVFEPFFTTKASGEGTGLGLAITQRLVLQLGGAISFTSTPGQGTTFRVLLPAAE